MTRRMVDLASPAELWSIAAAWSALRAAVFGETGLGPTTPGIAHLEDGGGSWFDLVLLPDGRAAIVGFDRGIGDFTLEGREDLLAAGAEQWWFAAPEPEVGHANFAYGYADGAWNVVGHVDGLTTEEHFLDAASQLLDYATQAYEDATDEDYPGSEVEARAVLSAGEFVDADTLRRLLPTEEFDIPLGVSTAALYQR